eukprot:CAMPEP_0175126044 /NCGR_PEP_ID=MMETSP0087-20121206/3636_1 /TAXON_ID=136419 /ORGANISM="Unknown Unknown, Strain D1" /LENGTH=84 /DNA_ID=CAMNT_0016407915 /DNA_START=32 /DNA_END=283 /DNA_ORIENTATION=+
MSRRLQALSASYAALQSEVQTKLQTLADDSNMSAKEKGLAKEELRSYFSFKKSGILHKKATVQAELDRQRLLLHRERTAARDAI